MAYGQEAYRRIQISNVEGTVGTAEAATEILFGKMKIKSDDRVYHQFDQDRNTLAEQVERPILVAKALELEFEADLYDRLAVFLFSNSIRGNVTATQPDSGDEPLHYRWVFEPSLSSATNLPEETDGIDTFTIEYGDNAKEYETPYVYTVKIEIEGEVGDDEDTVATVTWTIGGRQISESTFTAALTEPAAAYFPVNKAKFYIDTSYAGIGTTQKTGVLRAFKWTFETKFTARFAADGSYVFSGLNEGKKAPELELTMWRDDTIFEAELDKAQADPKTRTFIRIALESGVEMDAGQNNPPYIWLDGAYVYTDVPEFDAEDGTSVITMTAKGIKDPTSGKMMTATVGTKMQAFA